ncbi:MAG: pyrimidine dimer DNA glycosylase/endonuclease V [Nanoarchaeota archaeon]
MQTFLPYPNFEKSIKTLDYRRLGKQRVEAFQILNVLLNRTKSSAWRNHPAVLMWRGYENALKIYLNLCISEWISRGYKNTMKTEKINGKVALPTWLGKRKFHSSHKSNLLRKDKKHYSQFKWKEKDNLPYVWPTNKTNRLC